MLQRFPRSLRSNTKKFLVPFVSPRYAALANGTPPAGQACRAFVDSSLKAKLWEGVKTIAALIVALALLAFSCWLNVYWCFGWC